MEQEQIKINKEIINRLIKIQQEMNYLKEYIEDITLTEDDLIALEEAEKDLIQGKTKRL